jgi:hypothetical protein
MDSGLQQLPFRAFAQQDDALSCQAENHSHAPFAGLSQAVLDYFSDSLKTLSDRLQALDLNSQFAFLATILHFFVDHLPDTSKPELQASDLGADAISFATSDPLAHVPREAAEQVPENLPPNGLPQVVVDHVPDAATRQLAEHVDWLNDGDQFVFPDDLHALSHTLIESALLHVQAAENQTLDRLTQVDLNPMADAAAEQLTGHLDWTKIGDQLTFKTSEATHEASNEPPLSHVSDPGAELVPEQVPPQGLPDQALVNMAPTAAHQLEEHVQSLLQADQLAFSPSDPLQTTSISFDQTPTGPLLESILPADIQITDVPIETVENMTISTGVLGADDWLIS